MNRWTDMLDRLAGHPVPPLPGPAGRVIVAADEPLDPDTLHDVTDPVELRLLLGVSRQRAHQLIQQRAAMAHTTTERTEP